MGNQQTFFKLGYIIFKSSRSLCVGLFVVLAFLASSEMAVAADDQAAQSSRSPEFQKRIDAEKAAEDQRDRDFALQEQARKESAELSRLRAERAAQRNAAAAAAKQQEEQQQQQQK
jgi:type IV secretory pathway VirB6-like protein